MDFNKLENSFLFSNFIIMTTGQFSTNKFKEIIDEFRICKKIVSFIEG